MWMLIYIGIIMSCGLYAFYLQLGDLFRYRDALSFLRTIRKWKEADDYLARIAEWARDYRHSPWEAVLCSRDVRGSSLVVEHVRRVAEQEGDFEPQAVTELTLARERALFRVTFPAFMVSAALVAGLGGTFIAFVLLLQRSGLGNVLQSGPTADASGAATLQAAQALLPAFQIIYKGFGEVFFASLSGILVTLLLLLTSVLGVNAAREELAAELDDYTSSTLMPIYSAGRTGTTRIAKATEDAAKIIAASTESAARLATLGGNLVKLTHAVERTLGQNSQLSVVLQGVSEQLVSTESRWKTLLEALDATRFGLSDVVDHVGKHNEQVITAFREAMDSSAERADTFMRSLAGEIQGVAAARLEHFDDVRQTMQTGCDKLLKGWDERSSAALAQQGSATGKLLEQFSSSQGLMLKTLVSHAENLQSSLTLHVSECSAQIRATALSSIEQISAVTADRAELAGMTDQAATRLAALMGNHETAMQKRMENFSGSCGEVSLGLNAAMKEITASLKEAAASFASRPLVRPESAHSFLSERRVLAGNGRNTAVATIPTGDGLPDETTLPPKEKLASTVMPAAVTPGNRAGVEQIAPEADRKSGGGGFFKLSNSPVLRFVKGRFSKTLLA